MQCQEAREHIIGSLTGSLDETTRTDVRDHLARCASCRSERKAHDWIWGKLADIPGSSFNPGAMRARFDAMMAEQESAFRQAPAASFWRRPLVAAAAVAALLAVVAGVGWRAGWFTNRSTAVLLPKPVANDRLRTDSPEPSNSAEDRGDGKSHEAGVGPLVAQAVRIEEIEMLAEESSQASRNSFRMGRSFRVSSSIVRMVLSSSLIFDGYVTDITTDGERQPDVRWRISRVLKGSDNRAEIVIKMNGDRPIGERAIVFLRPNANDELVFRGILVADGDRVNSPNPRGAEGRRIEALTPEQVAEEIRRYSQSSEISFSVTVEGASSSTSQNRGGGFRGLVGRNVDVLGFISSMPAAFRDRFAAMRIVLSPANFALGAADPWRAELLLNDRPFRAAPDGRGIWNVPPQRGQPSEPTITSTGLVRDGLYRVSLDGIPFGFTLKSIAGPETADGRLDLLRDPLPVSEGNIRIRRPLNDVLRQPPIPVSAAVTLVVDPVTQGRTVRGRVSGVTGAPAVSPVWVSMRSDATENIRTGAVTAEVDGRFEFSNVPPGRYIVRVHQSDLPVSAGWAQTMMKLNVGGTDITHDLPLAVPGVPISGKVEVSDRRGRALPIPSDNLFVTFDRSYFASDRIKPDGTFAMTLPVGSYAIGISPLPAGYSLKSISSGLVDLRRAPLNVGSITKEPITIKIEYEF